MLKNKMANNQDTTLLKDLGSWLHWTSGFFLKPHVLKIFWINWILVKVRQYRKRKISPFQPKHPSLTCNIHTFSFLALL